MEYCITVNPIPHSQYRTKFDYEWSIEYQLIRNPRVSVNIRSANLLIFKILYYGMYFETHVSQLASSKEMVSKQYAALSVFLPSFYQ